VTVLRRVESDQNRCATSTNTPAGALYIRIPVNVLFLWSLQMIDTGRFRWGRVARSGHQAADMSWGNVLYRGAVALAVLIVVLAAGNYLYNLSQNRPLIPLIPLVFAGIVWLIGYGLRYLLNDR
jgi:hypothetical protein